MQFSGSPGWITIPDGSLIVTLLSRTFYCTTKHWFKYLHLVRLKLCSTVLLGRELRYCFSLPVLVALSSHTIICSISSFFLGFWIIWQPQKLLKEISPVVKAFWQWSWAANDLVSALQKNLNGIQSFLSTAFWLSTAQEDIRQRRWMSNTWSLYTHCLHRKEEKPPLLFRQHKEFIPINKEASYIHLFTLLRT